MKMETVIKEARPQMVGDYYDPYPIDIGACVEALDRTFPRRSKWRGARLRRPLMEVARVAEEIERDNK